MKKILYLSGLLFTASPFLFGQITRATVGTKSIKSEHIQLELVRKIQNYSSENLETGNVRDVSIYSPKSVVFLNNGKMYVNSLEGYTTSVFNTGSWERTTIIKHKFDGTNAKILHTEVPFGYEFQKLNSTSNNIFSGKPVEFTTSNNEKYLWVSYYRRSFDKNATQPSAVSIIDTDTDEIIASYPTGPLPKMIAASDVSKKLAVTHWGDNTVAIISIENEDPQNYVYEKHLTIGRKLQLDYKNGEKIDRDKNCGYCLRGTAFSENGQYLFIGRMGGVGKIDVFEMETFQKLGVIDGIKNNIRHIVIQNNEIFISTNITGYVQKASLEDFENSIVDGSIKLDWKSLYVGKGVRTISLTSDSRYLFAAVNNESKICIVDAKTLSTIDQIDTDSYPVGMDISPNNRWLAVTCQGKKREGGHAVSIYQIHQKKEK